MAQPFDALQAYYSRFMVRFRPELESIAPSATKVVDTFRLKDTTSLSWHLKTTDDPVTKQQTSQILANVAGTTFEVSEILTGDFFDYTPDVQLNGLCGELTITNNETFSINVKLIKTEAI